MAQCLNLGLVSYLYMVADLWTNLLTVTLRLGWSLWYTTLVITAFGYGFSTDEWKGLQREILGLAA